MNQSLTQDQGSYKLDPPELYRTLPKGLNRPSAIPNYNERPKQGIAQTDHHKISLKA